MDAILITGASSGLGRELALQLAEEGKTLYLVGQNVRRLEEVATAVRETGAKAIPYSCDLTEFDQMANWHGSLRAKGVTFQEAYLCAGRTTFGEMHDLSMSDIEWVYQINLLSPAQWISLLYPEMEQRGSGKIVLISSLSAFTGIALSAPYTGTKRAMLAMGRSIWPESIPAGISLHVAFPGFVRTRIFEASRIRNCDLSTILNSIRKLGFSMITPQETVASIIHSIKKGKRIILCPAYAKVFAFSGFRMPWIADILHFRFIRFVFNRPRKTLPPPAGTYKDKICLVTGAGSGIGKELVQQLLTEGAKVYALDISTDRLDQLQGETSHSDKLRTITTDISNFQEMERAAAQVQKESGHLDLLINNAGVTLIEETKNVSFQDWKRILDINYLGTLHGVRAFYPAMVKRGQGHIANVASLAGHSGYATAQAYAASKAAVIGFTRIMEIEARTRGIRISTVNPSYVSSNIFNDSLSDDWTDEKITSTFMTKPMSSAEAAGHALDGLRRGKKIITFPFSGRLLYWASSWAPWSIHPLQKLLLKKFLIAKKHPSKD